MKRQLLKQWQNRGKDARHFSFLGISILLFWGLCACNDHIDTTEPSGITEDAGLLKSQLDRIRTRAADANVIILVTTADSVGFKVVHSSDVVVDWGDNHTELNTFSHTYTDNYPVHTIGFSGTQQAITEFVCNNQELIFMDVTRSTALEKLNCSFNRLTELEVKNNLLLKELDCSINNLIGAVLDISKNTLLQTLFCYNNKLTQLDISKNILLETLSCHVNEIGDLNVTANNKLKALSCSQNKLKILDVSINLELSHLTCGNNQITTMDFRPNINLESLNCDNNNIIELNISENEKLRILSCKNNHLEVVILPVCPDLAALYLEGNPLISYLQRVNLITNLLPDRTGKSFGILSLKSPDIASEIRPLCQAKNWIVM